jgi:TonB family protein
MHPPMGSSIALAAVAVALAVQSAASPPPSAPLKPSSPWNVDFAESMCLLQRQFGTGDQAVMLGFKPGLFSEHMRVMLVKAGSFIRPIRGEAQLALDGGPPVKAPYIEFFIPKRNVRVISIDIKQFDPAPLNRAKQIRIEAGKRSFALEPTVVPAAMAVLDACQRDLLVSWGMDAKTVASIATYSKITGGLVGLFNYTDYPSAALRNNEQGTAGVRYWVSKEGTVRDCTIVESSGSASIDAQTCSIITKRGRFEPARTTSGEAVESIGFQRVRWEMSRS